MAGRSGNRPRSAKGGGGGGDERVRSSKSRGQHATAPAAAPAAAQPVRLPGSGSRLAGATAAEQAVYEDFVELLTAFDKGVMLDLVGASPASHAAVATIPAATCVQDAAAQLSGICGLTLNPRPRPGGSAEDAVKDAHDAALLSAYAGPSS